MMKKTRNPWIGRGGIAVAVVVAFGFGLAAGDGAPGSGDHADHNPSASIWTCSMHPQVQMPEFGACPLCGMDLIPLESPDSGDTGPRSISLSAGARAIAEVKTVPVERRAVFRTLRLSGTLEADESLVREIAARVSGRIDRLHVDSTGEHVAVGEALFDLFSPELYSAQEELLQAVGTAHGLPADSRGSLRDSAERTVEAARQRLRLWNLAPRQIQDIEAQGRPTDHITVVAPAGGVVLKKNANEGAYVQAGMNIYTIADLSSLWLQLDVYEEDLAILESGQAVEFQTRAFPGETFTGVVSFIAPVLDERTRTARVRVVVDNNGGRLKPGLLARAVLRSNIRTADGELPLVVPASAALFTGARSVVYVSDRENAGRYDGREVVLGAEADDFVVVLEGLEEGESVVSNGAFKIDSALQIQAKDSMMNSGRDGAAAEPEVIDVPRQFQVQLDGILLPYYAVAEALSLDDLKAARAAAMKLPEAIRIPDQALLPTRGHEPWSRAQADLSQHAASISGASNIGTARNAFYELSSRLITTVKQFHPSGREPVLVFHCPMARNSEGADWLQGKNGVENPYYGSKMFKCGFRKETIVDLPGADPDAENDQE